VPAHLRVRADGLEALVSAVEGHAVGRAALMSSLAAALGALNLGPYAASAVMDAYASRGRPGSAAWPACDSTPNPRSATRDGPTTSSRRTCCGAGDASLAVVNLPELYLP
jgi:hypothetical protein